MTWYADHGGRITDHQFQYGTWEYPEKCKVCGKALAAHSRHPFYIGSINKDICGIFFRNRSQHEKEGFGKYPLRPSNEVESSMTNTVVNTSSEKLLFYVWSADRRGYHPPVAIAAVGRKIQEEKLSCEGMASYCVIPNDPGFYVWQGELTYLKKAGSYLTRWTGNIRPAKFHDMQEMGVVLPKE